MTVLLAVSECSSFMAILAPSFDARIATAEHPEFPQLFFLGTADQRITLYSQQVRALHLVHALSEHGRLQDKPQVAVVGAGAAGITAALALATLGIEVDLIERSDDVLHLQSASTRLLHPHIYDWPRCGSLRSDAVLPFLDWKYQIGGDVCSAMRVAFAAALPRLPDLRFRNGRTLEGLKPCANGWTVAVKFDGKTAEQDYDIVILALGFGEEDSVGDAPIHDYWKVPAVSTATEAVKTSYLLSGNGDGGLADAMTLLIREFDHVGFTQEFLARIKDPDFGRKTAEIVDHHALDADLAPAFDRELAPLLERRDVAARLAPNIRKDRTLTLNCSGALLANGRAAPLNQVMTFAVLKAASAAGNPVVFTHGHISMVTKQGRGYVVTGPTSNGAPCQTVFDRVILRHGPDRQKRYAACAAFYDSYRRHMVDLRKTHGHLFVPPVLSAETYTFFEARHAKLLEHHVQDSLDGLRAHRHQTVQILWDEATHQPVQQGRLELLQIAAQCEQIPEACVIQLDLRPIQIKGYATALRQLAQLSNGRIALQASSDVAKDWEGMSSMGAFFSPYPIQSLPALDALHAARDRSLMRQLGASLTATSAAGNCPKLGAIHGSIASQLGKLWTKWDTALQADPPAMRHFLSHLEHATVTVASASTAKIEALTAALILMLATELQQPLRPARSDSGNFHFGAHDAVGLASGAESLQDKPIVDYCTPSDWGADALILSGAQATMDFEDDSLSDAGSAPTSADRAERVRPAVIQASKWWRSKLRDGLPGWLAGVESEFAAWRARQDKQLTKEEE